MPADHPRMLDVLRLAQGHWPHIHRELEGKRREAQAAARATPPSEAVAPDASREDSDPAP